MNVDRERESGDPKERYISDTAGGWNETILEKRGERGAVAERVDREERAIRLSGVL